MNTITNNTTTTTVSIYKATVQVSDSIYSACLFWANTGSAFSDRDAIKDTATRYAEKHGYRLVSINPTTEREAQSLINRGMSYSPIDEQAERDHDPSFTAEETTSTEAAEIDPADVDEATAEAVAQEIAAERITAARAILDGWTERSAWERGVGVYASDLLDSVSESIEGGWSDPDILESPLTLDRAMLNGAQNWNEYSWGGCALCYDGQIAERLCNPSELKRTHNGQRRPNSREEWLDVQTRALHQAAARVTFAVRRAIDGYTTFADAVRG